MNISNPLIVILMVPIFEALIYPALRKYVVITPLRKMAVGGILAALSFVMAGILQATNYIHILVSKNFCFQIRVNETMEPLPPPGQMYVYRIGNSTSMFRNTEGFELLASTKNVWPVQNHSLLDSSNSTAFELALNPSKYCGYIVGLFDIPNTNGYVFLA
jgi:hypothetical protein